MGTGKRWRPGGTGLAVGAFIGLLAHELNLRAFVSLRSDDLLLVPVLAGVAALLWHTRAWIVFSATAGLLAILWLTAAFSPLSRWLSGGLVRRDALRIADAVFVLSSDIQPDGDPTSVAQARLLHGLELISQGYADRIIISELLPPSGSYAAVTRPLMDHLRLRQELAVVGPVRNTHDEAIAVTDLCRTRGWRRILLVTSPSHSRRASAAFERMGLEIVSAPCPETRFDFEGLSTPGDRLTAFSSVAHERIGLWLYHRRGWIP
jgi:uncharacterized SAM-binding protein YcdF (DUF218 family)